MLAPAFHTEFTPIAALIGGGLIGAAAAIFWVLNGRIAGVSSILSRLLPFKVSEDAGPGVAFAAGLITAPAAYMAWTGKALPLSIAASSPALIIAGMLVGAGTVLANGCTSGHGVCGIARLSRRSLAATATFISAAIFTVSIVRHGMGT